MTFEGFRLRFYASTKPVPIPQERIIIMKKLMILVAIMIAISATFKGDGGVDKTEDILRLHIIASSNNNEDQAVKLLVRDAVLELEREIFSPSSYEDARELLIKHGNELLDTVNEVLAENGFDYGCMLSLGKYDFPDRTYGDVTYPADEYNALRIVLGEGAGENWWCVLFPPLCIVETPEADLNSEEHSEDETVEFDSIILKFLRKLFKIEK